MYKDVCCRLENAGVICNWSYCYCGEWNRLLGTFSFSLVFVSSATKSWKRDIGITFQRWHQFFLKLCISESINAMMTKDSVHKVSDIKLFTNNITVVLGLLCMFQWLLNSSVTFSCLGQFLSIYLKDQQHLECFSIIRSTCQSAKRLLSSLSQSID